MKANPTTTWPPTRPRASAGAQDPFMGIRAPIGTVGGSRILTGIRRAAGFGRGAVVPNGIVLKEGET